MSRTFRKGPVRERVNSTSKLKNRIKEYPDKEGKNRKASRGCLNHGSCSYCEDNRTYRNKRRETKWGLED